MGEIYKYAQPGVMNPGMMNPVMNAGKKYFQLLLSAF